MIPILMLNGPNLNLLGAREPGIYGIETLEQIAARLSPVARELGVELHWEQRNGEGELIDLLHGAAHWASGVVFNPGAYSHYSYAIADAIAAISTPVIEVHLSNIYAREHYRRRSVISPVASGVISGVGALGYELGLRAAVELALRAGPKAGSLGALRPHEQTEKG